MPKKLAFLTLCMGLCLTAARAEEAAPESDSAAEQSFAVEASAPVEPPAAVELPPAPAPSNELPSEVKRIEDTARGFRELAAVKRRAAEAEQDPTAKAKLLEDAAKIEETASLTEKKALEELLLLKSAEVLETRERERQAKQAYYEAEKALEEARASVATSQGSAVARAGLAEQFLAKMDLFKDREAQLKQAAKDREEAESKAKSASS